MNVLFIHEVDWLSKVVFDIHSVVESLSLLGHHVFAIDYEGSWHRTGLLDFGSLKTRQFDGVSRAYPGASVSLRRPGFIKIPGLSRLSAGFTHYREIQKTIREKKIDAIVLYGMATNGLQTAYLARKLNVPVVFRSIDILYNLVPVSALRPITKAIEKRVYRQVDMILPNTPQYLKYVIQMGAPESRVKLLLFPIDTALFHPGVDPSEVRRKWGLDEKKQVIVFVGTLFEFSGLDSFIRHFPEVKQQVPEARLLIVGDGPQRTKLERIIAELGLEKEVTITGFQPYPTMPQYMNLADVCINTFPVSEMTRDIFPGKMVQFIACGRATVATPLPGIKTLLPGESHGVVYAGSADEMAADVVLLLKSPERRRQLGLAGAAYVKQNHDYRIIARQLETILQELIKEKRNESKRVQK